MATIDPSQPQQHAASPVEADLPAVSFAVLIGAALVTIAALLTAVSMALSQQ